MSAEAQREPDIQLHFCQACGISIPQPDIDAGRASTDPDTCAWIKHPEKCPIKFAEQLKTPARPMRTPARPMAPIPSAAPPPRTGTYVIATIALLYVVGTTTFLLARELTRKPVPDQPTGFLTASDLAKLEGQVAGMNEWERSAFADLKSNDDRQRQDLSLLSGKVNALTQEQTRLHARMDTRMQEVEGAVVALANKAGLLKEEVEAAVRELRDVGDRMRKGGGSSGGEARKPEPKANKPVSQPPPSAADQERDRLVKQYIDKLTDRNASNQTRYNAAVQLGDLKDPKAIQALIDALKTDPYDLVRRASAWSLGMFGKDSVPAIPALISQIGGKEEYVGYMCERALGEITKAVLGKAVTFNFDPTMNSRARKKVQKQWEAWWEKNKAQLNPDGQ